MATSNPPMIIPPAHKASGSGDRCPWCDQPISHEKFEQLRARIAAQERQNAAKVERDLKERLGEERAQLQAQAKAEADRARAASDAAIAKATKDAAAREAKARAEAKRTTEAALAPKLSEAQEARAAAERQVQELQSTQKTMLTERLREQREALEKAKTEAVNAEKSRAFSEKLKLDATVQRLQRQIQKKTADELGEGAEVDLFESLKAEFPDDLIRRIGKGVAGADIVHEVRYNGKICGRIVYDSKNRNAWQNSYVTKLRRDQLAAEADHAILSTQVFPSGARQLHVQNNVIVANPARVMALVEMLRRHLVQTHALRLSGQARDQKTVALYDFITSEHCAQLFEQIDTTTDELLGLDVKEKKSHDATWSRRGELVRSVQRARGTLVSEIEKIIGTADAERSA